MLTVESCFGHCRSDHEKGVNVVNGPFRPRTEPEDDGGDEDGEDKVQVM